MQDSSELIPLQHVCNAWCRPPRHVLLMWAGETIGPGGRFTEQELDLVRLRIAAEREAAREGWRVVALERAVEAPPKILSDGRVAPYRYLLTVEPA